MLASRKTQIPRRCVYGLILCCPLGLALSRPAQATALATLSYPKNTGSAFSAIYDEGKPYAPAWLPDMSRVIAAAEAYPRTVKITGRGSAAIFFSSQPRYPKRTDSPVAAKEPP